VDHDQDRSGHVERSVVQTTKGSVITVVFSASPCVMAGGCSVPTASMPSATTQVIGDVDAVDDERDKPEH